MRDDAYLPQSRRKLLKRHVRSTQPLALDVEHAEDDIEVVLHHHGVHIAPNGQERRVLNRRRRGAARLAAEQRQLAEELAWPQRVELGLVPALADGQPDAPRRDDEHLRAGIALTEDHRAFGKPQFLSPCLGRHAYAPAAMPAVSGNAPG